METQDYLDLREVLHIIRMRKWVIVRAVLVTTLAAVVLSVVQPRSYESEARVLISEKGSGADVFGSLGLDISSQPERGLMTQVQLMQVRPLLENTIRTLGLGVSPEELARRVSVTAVGQTNIVSIKATDADTAQAAAIANTLAEEFVTWSRDYKRESIQAAATEVETRLEEAKAEILDLGKRISSEGKTDDLSAELAIAIGKYTTLSGKLEELKINEQLEVGSGRVVSPGVVTDSPVAPRPLRNVALALVLGLVLGLGMALLWEYLDNTIKSSEQAEGLYGAPVLGLIPAEKFEKGEKRRLTIIQHPGSPASEAYRVLRNSLDFVNFEHNIKTLLVTSAAPAEGKSTVAANLAASLAQAGKKVVLLNSDFRRPTTDQFFTVNNIIGLADVLAGSNTLKAALQQPFHDMDLLVMTPGKMPPNPSELLGSTKMEELINTLGEWADWVIIDSPPLLAVADGAAVARWADGVLLVTKGGESTTDAASNSREMLAQVGARIAGVVVWGLEGGPGGGGYGYYGNGTYGGYYYSQYYANAPADGRRSSKGGSTPATSAVNTEAPTGAYVPVERPGRTLLKALGRILTGVFMAVAIIALAVLVLYFADQAMGWGIASGVLG